ncbi:hypothetical protein B14_200088 (plasmid) [Bacillus licheniformis]|mgnify:CR=1 FL=1|uniref:hypothetical protein n=1 Tax=Bacillus subtilis group TaxID=653685 RepID=UPI0009B7681A|nr:MULTISPECIES: hypothetical protein [Bacillus subtilis group]ARC67299.1 hypothetical protein B14_200088 [Bacillus licheniformis]ARW46059.1 hypothetical protein S100141_04839 [Bacillus licheniformis]MCY1628329.1 hypothetical protein [Bacillus paralicheniformis]MDE1421954.1 hypothetical protein [Bacillus licheniformis]MEC0475959.1 hypothetical protein [Bacillus licheniformis]
MKILLNRFEDPRLSEQIYIGKGDKVYANKRAEEYGFTTGKKYEVQGVSPFGYLIMKNNNGDIDEYTVEFFQKHMPLI